MFLALDSRMNTYDYLPSWDLAWSLGKNFFLVLEKRDQETKESMKIDLGKSEMEY